MKVSHLKAPWARKMTIMSLNLLKVVYLLFQTADRFLEEIRHHSDEEQREQRTNTRPANTKQHTGEEHKQIKVNEQRKNGSSPNKNQQKKDYYLYQGEEKPYESDPEDQNQGRHLSITFAKLHSRPKVKERSKEREEVGEAIIGGSDI